jgi:hypothetical protein
MIDSAAAEADVEAVGKVGFVRLSGRAPRSIVILGVTMAISSRGRDSRALICTGDV